MKRVTQSEKRKLVKLFVDAVCKGEQNRVDDIIRRFDAMTKTTVRVIK